MNELMISGIKIEDLIYEVRGKQVMLASDVAKLYQVETKVLNQVVKRNLNRFPEDFCFQLTQKEWDNLRSQFAMSKNGRGGIRYLPYVFTEHGVMMLSGLLKSDIAVQVNVAIINAFVAMRKYISTNLLGQQYINDLVLKDSKRIDLLEETFSSFKDKNNHLFFEGQIYDAYSLMLNIFDKSSTLLIFQLFKG